MTNGPLQTFKCYSAVNERYPSVRERNWSNFDSVRGKKASEVAKVLSDCLPEKANRVRVHTAGDFFSEKYFLGWLELAQSKPKVQFWAFTKSLPFWISNISKIPPNLEMIASYGGRWDHMIKQYGLKYAKVVRSSGEAKNLGLKIDTNDKLAAFPGPSFALLENFSKRKS